MYEIRTKGRRESKADIVKFALGYSFDNKNMKAGLDFCKNHVGKDINAPI